jgi:hypothetical protein
MPSREPWQSMRDEVGDGLVVDFQREMLVGLTGAWSGPPRPFNCRPVYLREHGLRLCDASSSTRCACARSPTANA